MSTSSSATLAIWSPRPNAKGCEHLSSTVTCYGLPAIRIVPILLSEEQKTQLQLAQVLLFVSQHAVVQLLSQISSKLLCKKTIIAIGEKTAAKLSAVGLLPQIIAKPPFNSEKLLSEKAFQDLEYERLILVCGQGGRQLLQQAITAKGKQVVRIECYQRDSIHYRARFMIEFITKYHIRAVIFSSCAVADAALNCLKLTTPIGFFDWPVFVLSQRIGDYAMSLGFTQIIVAPQASQQSLNQTILTWWENR